MHTIPCHINSSFLYSSTFPWLSVLSAAVYDLTTRVFWKILPYFIRLQATLAGGSVMLELTAITVKWLLFQLIIAASMAIATRYRVFVFQKHSRFWPAIPELTTLPEILPAYISSRTLPYTTKSIVMWMNEVSWIWMIWINKQCMRTLLNVEYPPTHLTEFYCWYNEEELE